MPRGRKPRRERKLPLAVYVSAELMDRLKEAADNDRRSLSNQAVVILERALELPGRARRT